MINFPWLAPGIARSNNCRGLLIALGEARTSALWPCRLSQGAFARAMEISVFSCSCKGNARCQPGEIVLNIKKIYQLKIIRKRQLQGEPSGRQLSFKNLFPAGSRGIADVHNHFLNNALKKDINCPCLKTVCRAVINAPSRCAVWNAWRF